MFFSALGKLLALTSVGAALWGFVFGPMWLGYAGVGLTVVSMIAVGAAESPQNLINRLVKKRRRGWGQQLTDQERTQYGSYMVFEPVCLVPSCDGAVVAVMSDGRLRAEPFVQRRPEVDGFYTQGPARCARCGQKYIFTFYGDSISLSDTLIGPSLRGNFPML
jgi:hypothetical protein